MMKLTTRHARLRVRLAALTLAAAMAAACGSTPPSRFYLLTPVEAAGDVDAAQSELSVRLAVVDLPDYLSAPEIVTRKQGSQLEFAEFERWGEPLDVSFARVLAQNLVLQLSTDQVVRFPWQRTSGEDYTVIVSVLRFDTEAGQAILEAGWTVSAPGAAANVRRSRISRALDGTGWVAIVAAMSHALADFSAEIAAEIRLLAGTSAGS